MVAVVAAFVLSGEVYTKLIGVGLAAAVLIDATVVRMVLVPAVMQLLGERNWWLPRWLDREMPRLELEPQPAGARSRLRIRSGAPGDPRPDSIRRGPIAGESTPTSGPIVADSLQETAPQSDRGVA